MNRQVFIKIEIRTRGRATQWDNLITPEKALNFKQGDINESRSSKYTNC